MRRVWSRFGGRASQKRGGRVKPINRVLGLPKRELTRRLAGMGVSLHDEESVIRTALRYVEAFLDFIRLQDRCAGCGKKGPGDPHHVLTRGARHGDIGNAVKLCRDCHDQVPHDPGRDYTDEAEALGLEFLAQRPDVAAFLAERRTEGVS